MLVLPNFHPASYALTLSNDRAQYSNTMFWDEVPLPKVFRYYSNAGPRGYKGL